MISDILRWQKLIQAYNHVLLPELQYDRFKQQIYKNKIAVN